jgi:hypothetical protein
MYYNNAYEKVARWSAVYTVYSSSLGFTGHGGRIRLGQQPRE